METLGPGGWACPGTPAFVRAAGAACPVTGIHLLSAAQLADALREPDTVPRSSSPGAPAVTLARVQAQRPHWRDRSGTTDHCVDARFLRGWQYGRDGLVVDMAPGRHGGQRYYRVEMAETCSDLGSVQSIALESRIGAAAICGRPGDRVVLKNDAVVAGSFAAPHGFAQMGGPRGAGTAGRNCEITRVTPLRRE